MVGGHEAERLGRQPLAELGRNRAALPDLGHDLGIAGRIGHRGHAGVVAGRGREQGRAADVDHLDRLVDRHEPAADLRRERR